MDGLALLSDFGRSRHHGVSPYLNLTLQLIVEVFYLMAEVLLCWV